MWEKLIENSKQGDKEATKEVIVRLKPLVISSIKRYYYNIAQYEDLIQDGNLAILEAINTFDSSKGIHFLGYIKVTLKYLYLNKHRIKATVSLNEPIGDDNMEMMDLLKDEAPSPLDEIISLEDMEELNRLLNILTSRQREVIILYYIENISIDEIANRLDISYRTVVNTKVRAMEKMRK